MDEAVAWRHLKNDCLSSFQTYGVCDLVVSFMFYPRADFTFSGMESRRRRVVSFAWFVVTLVQL